MAANIVLPSLSNWAQERLSAVLKATTTDTFNEAFDGFLAKNVNITVNGVHLSRDQYKKQLQGEESVDQGAIVKFDGTVEVPTDKNHPVSAGIVGLFYEATLASRFLVDASPAETKITSSLNITVAQDNSLTPPHRGPIHGDFDGRRVVTLNQVFIDNPVPITLGPNSA